MQTKAKNELNTVIFLDFKHFWRYQRLLVICSGNTNSDYQIFSHKCSEEKKSEQNSSRFFLNPFFFFKRVSNFLIF